MDSTSAATESTLSMSNLQQCGDFDANVERVGIEPTINARLPSELRHLVSSDQPSVTASPRCHPRVLR